MLSDLIHVLENVVYSTNCIELKNPIEFTNSETGLKSFIIKVYKKNKSWKAVDIWYNEFTISKLDNVFQSNIYYNILSMYDNRVESVQYNLSI